MIKLIRADLARLLRSRLLWVCGGLAVGLMMAMFFLDYVTNFGRPDILGQRMLASTGYAMFFSAVFVPLFIGADYSSGTVRNKISVGHRRCELYFSNLAVSSVGGLILCGICWLTELIAGGLSKWGFGMELPDFWGMLCVCALAEISLCSLLTLTAMLIGVRSSSVVVSVIGFLGLLFVMILLPDVLARPKEDVLYIGGVLRGLLSVSCDLLPMGQVAQFIGMDAMRDIDSINSSVMSFYSAGFVAVISALGLRSFGRKDLK